MAAAMASRIESARSGSGSDGAARDADVAYEDRSVGAAAGDLAERHAEVRRGAPREW